MGIRKSYYRESQGEGVLFKPEKAKKNRKELTEEEVTMDCTEKGSIGMDKD